MENFKAIFNKKYPLTTKARKIWVVVVSVIIPLIVIIIIFNLANSQKLNLQSEKNNTLKKHVQEVATQQDTDWYRIKLASQKEKLSVQSLILGKSASNSNMNDSDIQKAMTAAITANQITRGSLNQDNDPSSTNQQDQSSRKDNTDEPQAFLNDAKNNSDYLAEKVQSPISQYELQAGSIIPAVLVTGINSDLPGQIIAQVTENTYDSITGNNLLIPQGTKIVGVYDSKIAYGQERVLVAWKRLIFPSGKSLDLDGMPGIDMSGYAGFNDEIDNHYGKIFGSVILMSFLSTGAQLSQPQNTSNQNLQPTVNQMLAQSLGTNVANTGTIITQKNLNIQPTLQIRAGYQFDISVAKDIVFYSN